MSLRSHWVATVSSSLPHRSRSSPATPSLSNLPGIQAVRCRAVHVGVTLNAALHRLGVPPTHRDDGGHAGLERRQVHEVVTLEQALTGEAQAAKAAAKISTQLRLYIWYIDNARSLTHLSPWSASTPAWNSINWGRCCSISLGSHCRSRSRYGSSSVPSGSGTSCVFFMRVFHG